MSATNHTTYYEFPIFVGSDKPAWLVDWNGAMTALDSAIHEAKAEADANATDIATLQSSVSSLSGSVESQGTSITTLTQSLTSLQGTVNTITSLIGNGLPTTDDKTIIGAINELKADIDALDPSGQGVQAENVSYDNTTSGLTADDVQGAIDEINAKIPQSGNVDADDVAYDNTSSGLTATNVQDAIDELASGGSAPYDVTNRTEIDISSITLGKVGQLTLTAGYYQIFADNGSTGNQNIYGYIADDATGDEFYIYFNPNINDAYAGIMSAPTYIPAGTYKVRIDGNRTRKLYKLG